MTQTRWLSDQEQQAWRSLTRTQESLIAFIERRLRARAGISRSDYEMLAHLSEAPAGQLRSFELCDLLSWEKKPVVTTPEPDAEPRAGNPRKVRD